ncbi:MAG: hypothetical protein HUU20_26290 [Pirellulales bacterium]|nr:hypothetical protein [Pirellulales bacterium]
MSEAFDPYYTWLAIPPEEQPPNHYRLLGLRPFEDNPEVIENAANQRMAHLRSFQTGKRSAMSQKLLNEVAGARVCLLNPAKKTEYDAWLRQQQDLAEAGRQSAAAEAQLSTAMYGFVQSLKATQTAQSEPLAPMPVPPPRLESWRHSRKQKSVLAYAGVAVAALLLAAAGTWLFSSGRPPQPNGPLKAVQTSRPSPPAEKDTPVREPRPEKNKPETNREASPVPMDPMRLVGDPRLEPPTDLEPPMPRETRAKPAVKPQEPSPMSMATSEPGGARTAEPPIRSLADLLSDDITAKQRGRLRLPVPDAADQEKARKLLEELFGREKAAAESPVQKLALVQKLVDQADKSDDDAAARFMVLSMARELAAEASNPARAVEIAEKIGDRYEVDLLEMKLECLEASLRTAKKSGDRAAVAKAALPLIDEAIAEDRYDMVKWIGEMAEDAARRARENLVAKEATERMDAAEGHKKRYDEVKVSLDALTADPNDAGANAAVGQYYVLKNNWEKALQHLAAGTDVELKRAAEKELRGAASPEDQAALGDAWWDLAQTRQDPQRAALLRHAGTWYSRSQVLLPDGIVKRRIEIRLKEIADLPQAKPQSREASATTPRARKLPFNRWAPLFTSSKELLGWKTEGADFEYKNDVLDLRNSGIAYPLEAANIEIQARVRKGSAQNLTLRLRIGPNGHYAAWYNGGTAFGIGRELDGVWQDLKSGGPPNDPPEVFVFTFSAVDQTLRAFMNGQPILEVQDSTHTKGYPGLSTSGGNSWFTEVQARLLDKPSREDSPTAPPGTK